MLDFIELNSANFFFMLIIAMLAAFVFAIGVAGTIEVLRYYQSRKLYDWLKIVLRNGNLTLFTLNEKRSLLPYVTRKNTELILSELIAELSGVDEEENKTDILLMKALKEEYIRWEKLQTISSPIARGSLAKLAVGEHHSLQDIDLLIDELDRVLTIEKTEAEQERKMSKRSYILAFFGFLFSLPSLINVVAPYFSKMFE
ncbi:hypothetical protein M3703_04315 [Mannheimia haemolytica]|uniref:hypothetical protein n=1 Tax=Mannheimia haemolytica TaxID=75985 RepID=UPI00201C1D2E|nr:hypothetical protein [Mannheimia haemolytica]UQX68826.1 hypothetical protein M3705_07360 [Mannheimia haemolytica]UQX80547.1 hypothetical protein M3703_04315 [Mannheimia haemolytica]